jgi:hypothetical protein
VRVGRSRQATKGKRKSSSVAGKKKRKGRWRTLFIEESGAKKGSRKTKT